MENNNLETLRNNIADLAAKYNALSKLNADDQSTKDILKEKKDKILTGLLHNAQLVEKISPGFCEKIKLLASDIK